MNTYVIWNVAPDAPCSTRPISSVMRLVAKMQTIVPAASMASTRINALRRPMKSLQRLRMTPPIELAKKNREDTLDIRSTLTLSDAAMLGSAGVIMLAFSWNASTQKMRVVIKPTRRPPRSSCLAIACPMRIDSLPCAG